MSRIKLTDSFMDMVVKMAEGNPGAVDCLLTMSAKTPKIDPQSAFGAFSTAMSLDTHEIYGSDIYILYNDKCGRDARKMCLLLRAVQLGIIPESKLKDMASDQMREINLSGGEWADIDSKVCEQLDQFQK